MPEPLATTPSSCSTCQDTGRYIPSGRQQSLTCPDCLGGCVPLRRRRRPGPASIVVLASSRVHFEAHRDAVRAAVPSLVRVPRYAFSPRDLRGLGRAAVIVELHDWQYGRTAADLRGFDRSLARLRSLGATIKQLDPDTGTQLRAWRERHGLTQAEAAPLFGTNQQRINEQEQREAVRPYYARLVECTGACRLHEGRCEARNGEDHPVTGSRVVLTVAHWPDATKHNVEEANLHAWCQRCHLAVDHALHVANRRYGRHHRGPDQLRLELVNEPPCI